MTDCGGCGDCCENLPLNTPQRADIYGKRILVEPRNSDGEYRKMAAWMANLTPVEGPTRVGDQLHWSYSCPRFDKETRRCTDYANRPAVCRDFPHYGQHGPYKRYGGGGSYLSPRCTFNADHRTMLPIVEVRSGLPRTALLRPETVA